MIKELWKKMLASLATKVSVVYYDLWINTLEAITISENKLVLSAQNENVRALVLDKFGDILTNALREIEGSLEGILVITKDQKSKFCQRSEAVEGEKEEGKIDAVNINPKFNFETFVVGKSNQFMHAAALAVAESPGKIYNPLFIYGGTGLGKTHIMHAIANHVIASSPGVKILYASSEKFLNDYIEAVRLGKGKAGEFRLRYRKIDILLIDDIQFIAGKPGVQEELFHTFNALNQEGKQLVFTADRQPKEIKDLEDRLQSRFEGGLMVDVQRPDLETRIAILQKKSQDQRVNIPSEVLAKIATKSGDGNIRELEGLLNKVIFLSKLTKQPPSVELVVDAKVDYPEESDEEISVQRVIYAVCKHFDIRTDELIGKKKNREFTLPRHICIYLINDIASLPLAKIGEWFSGRDHTNILFARNKIAEQLKTDKELAKVLTKIREMATNNG